VYHKSNTAPGFTVTLAVSNSVGSSTKTRTVQVWP
jgi:hypothetical protein